MRRGFLTLVLLQTLAVATAVGAFAARASLDVLTVHPFKVHGIGFRPTERTRVVLVLSDRDIRLVRRVTANRAGSFAISFTGARVGRCDAFAVIAHGDRGSAAVLRRREVHADCPGPSLAP